MSQQATGGNREIRFIAVALFTLLFSLCGSAEAQQTTKVPRIGFLGGSTPDAEKDRLAGFQQGLRDLGYIEGKTILIEQRYAEGKLDRSSALAAELVHLNVDVIVVTYLPRINPVKEAT